MVARLYLEYGDVAIVEEAYPAMQLYVDNALNLVDPTTGLLTVSEFGDWYPPYDGVKVDSDIVSSVWLYRDLEAVGNMASLIQRYNDAAKVRYMELTPSLAQRTLLSRTVMCCACDPAPSWQQLYVHVSSCCRFVACNRYCC
jgi:hypothetical protein